jgi:hypothetical protein
MLPRRFLLVSVLMLGIAPLAAQTVLLQKLRGTIADVTSAGVVVDANGQHFQVAVPPSATILWVLPARIEDIKPGSYIGTAALPRPNGTLMATEMHVFPENMRGVREGHRPWDLQPESTMTNGTVGDVVGTSGRTLTVTYKGGRQTIVVPPGVPIVTFAPADRSALTPGAHVFLLASKDANGALTAQSIAVGKNGLVPPM